MIDTTSKDTSTVSQADENMFVYSLGEVDQHVSYLTAWEDGVTGFQHFLLEPEFNRDCLNGSVGLGTCNSTKGFNIESFSCGFEYEKIKFDNDALDLYFIQGGEETEGYDDKLEDTDEKVPKNFGLQSACEETLLVAEPGDAVSNLNYGAREESCLGNVALESHSPLLQERDSDAENSKDSDAENSNLSSDRVKVIESSCHESTMSLDQMTVQELHKVFCRMFGHETSVIDKQWLKHHITCGMQSQCKLVNGLNMFESLKTSKVNEEKTIVLSARASSGTAPDSFKDILDSKHISGDKHVKKEKLARCNSLKVLPSLVGEVGCCSMGKTNAEGVLGTQKRMNKSTRSFTQAPQLQTSRYSYRKYGPSDRNLRDKFLDVRSHKKYHQKDSGATRIVCQEESLKASSVQVSFGLSLQKKKPKKYTSYLGYDSRDSKENGVSVSNEDFDSEPASVKSQDYISEDDCVTSSTQRGRKWKQDHRRWTPGEVRKLIIGVTEHGVGKWTHIKRLLFSSSHRTSVNLKDKWRNLLKVSSSQAQRKSKVQQRQVQESYQLPESVLCQVRELAIIYAYPRKSKPSMSCTA